MYQEQPRQMEGIASVLADQGRYGDSMLVHMNPAEVQGLASLSPTGSLTVNPQTGQPEAFLGMILGALGSLGAGTGVAATLGLSGLSSAALGAIGSGLGTFIETGDLKKGLLGGLTGYGIGKFVGSLGGIETGTDTLLSDVADKSITATSITPTADAGRGIIATASREAAGMGPATASLSDVQQFVRPRNIVDNLKDVAGNPEGLIDAATAAGAAVPAAVGLGGRAAIEAEEAMERQFGADAEARKAMGERQEQIIAQSGFDPFLQPAKVPVSNYGIDTATYTASAGGMAVPGALKPRMSAAPALASRFFTSFIGLFSSLGQNDPCRATPRERRGGRANRRARGRGHRCADCVCGRSSRSPPFAALAAPAPRGGRSCPPSRGCGHAPRHGARHAVGSGGLSRRCDAARGPAAPRRSREADRRSPSGRALRRPGHRSLRG